MKATVIAETGGPEVLTMADRDDPRPGAGEILVEVAAAGLNFIDTYQRSGLYPVALPYVPGLEGSGSVVEIGEGVEGVTVGDRVAWAEAPGSYAERIALPADRSVPIPEDVDDRTAAAVMLQGLTAHYLATGTFPLASGHICLIHAGAGGVGLLLTQIAKLRGATVITTVGTPEKAEISRSAGADEVIVYTSTDFGDAVEEFCGPNSLDVVFDGVGAATFERGLDVLKPRGTMVTFGNASGPVPPVAPLTLTQKGSLYLTRPTMRHYTQTREELMKRASDLFEWIGSGDLTVTIGAEYQLSDAPSAHQALEGRQTTGKVLLIP